MQLLRNMPIRHKLTFITMLAVMAALMAASAALSTYDYVTFRRGMIQRLQTHADLVGRTSLAALSFEDAKEAAANLASLRADPHVVAGALYTPDGRVLARYFRDILMPIPAASDLHPGPARIGADRLELATAIRMGSTPLGFIYIRTDVQQLNQRIINYAALVAIVFPLSAAIALVLLGKLRWYIIEPILHLTETAKIITGDKNYSIRAEKPGNDELGGLIDCFNEMLAEIQTRDRQLQGNRDHLEEQVLARTEELRSVNSTLEAAKERAEAASRAKTAFLANMSHEIRTPMTAIIGYADVMLEPDRTQSDRQDCLQVIRRNARHLLELINDILDISKIEAGKMVLDRIACDLPQLISEVSSLLRARAMEKGLELRVLFDGRIPRTIQTDPLRVKQVLINLLGNGIKFSTSGCITLRIGCTAGEGDSRIQFDVSDNGIGMTAAQIERLFQPFAQGDDSMSRKYGGTGLGLAISKRLALLLGGDITVTSAPGKGSSFRVVIAGGPLDQATLLDGLSESVRAVPRQIVAQRKITLRGRILLAEDGEDNQALISMHLRKAGAEVVVAANGRVAVSLARSQPFDLILMDMQMPELDGYGATSELRGGGCQLPIIALTAHAMVGDRERCMKAGCTDYLTKPIDKPTMLATIQRYLEGGAPQLPAGGRCTINAMPTGGCPSAS